MLLVLELELAWLAELLVTESKKKAGVPQPSLDAATEPLGADVELKRPKLTTAQRKKAIQAKLLATGEAWDPSKWRRNKKRKKKHKTGTTVEQGIQLTRNPVSSTQVHSSNGNQLLQTHPATSVVECNISTTGFDNQQSIDAAAEQLDADVQLKKPRLTTAQRRAAIQAKLLARGEVWDPRKWRRVNRKKNKLNIDIGQEIQLVLNPGSSTSVHSGNGNQVQTHPATSVVEANMLTTGFDNQQSLDAVTERLDADVQLQKPRLTTAQRRAAIQAKLLARGEAWDPRKWRRVNRKKNKLNIDMELVQGRNFREEAMMPMFPRSGGTYAQSYDRQYSRYDGNKLWSRESMKKPTRQISGRGAREHRRERRQHLQENGRPDNFRQ